MAIRRRHASAVGVVAVAAWLMAGVVATVPARADTDEYLNNLRNAQIQIPGGDVELLEWGWSVCRLFKGNGVDNSYEKVRAHAIYLSRGRPEYGLTVEQADTIMHLAVTDLCEDSASP